MKIRLDLDYNDISHILREYFSYLPVNLVYWEFDEKDLILELVPVVREDE